MQQEFVVSLRNVSLFHLMMSQDGALVFYTVQPALVDLF